MLKNLAGKSLFIIIALTLVFSSVAAAATTKGAVKLKGTIDIDGSSTVFPLTEAVAEKFGKANKGVRVPVGVSGTGGGFKRFCAGEIAIANASRPIKESEAKICADKGIEYILLTVAYDGISVVTNPKNTWAKKLTVEQLKMIFDKDSKVKTWKDVDSAWPDKEIKIYSPGADSGTFDYFTEAINGKAKQSRNDKQISFSEDDNTLVQGISQDQYAIGYFGFSYYEENMDKLTLVSVDNGKAIVAPSLKTIADGTYAPLSRPLLIYVSKKALKRNEVKEFVKYYMTNVGKITKEVGFVGLSSKYYISEARKIK